MKINNFHENLWDIFVLKREEGWYSKFWRQKALHICPLKKKKWKKSGSFLSVETETETETESISLETHSNNLWIHSDWANEVSYYC